MAWGVHSVVNERLRKVEDVDPHRPGTRPRTGLASTGDTVVITAGEPFGQPGSTNSLRIETLH